MNLNKFFFLFLGSSLHLFGKPFSDFSGKSGVLEKNYSDFEEYFKNFISGTSSAQKKLSKDCQVWFMYEDQKWEEVFLEKGELVHFLGYKDEDKNLLQIGKRSFIDASCLEFP